MKFYNWLNGLHLELLEKYGVSLGKNGEVFSDDNQVNHDEEIIIGYRDEGPDAWANSKYFDGPAWVWTGDCGWEFYEKGVTITGYHGLVATIVNVQKDGLHVANCSGEEY